MLRMVSMAHIDLYEKSFYCSSILIWNEIMNKIDVSVSFPQFKVVYLLVINSLKKWNFLIYNVVYIFLMLFDIPCYRHLLVEKMFMVFVFILMYSVYA